MNSQIFESLNQAITDIDSQISDLTRKRDTLLEVTQTLKGIDENEQDNNRIIANKKPASAKEKVAKKIVPNDTGKIKFSKALQGIFESRPDEQYSITDLANMLDKQFYKS